MSHERRTPLNAIIGLTEMMVTNAARFGTEKALEPLRRVNAAGTHLLSLINEVLDLSNLPPSNSTPCNRRQRGKKIVRVVDCEGDVAELACIARTLDMTWSSNGRFEPCHRRWRGRGAKPSGLLSVTTTDALFARKVQRK